MGTPERLHPEVTAKPAARPGHHAGGAVPHVHKETS